MLILYDLLVVAMYVGSGKRIRQEKDCREKRTAGKVQNTEPAGNLVVGCTGRPNPWEWEQWGEQVGPGEDWEGSERNGEETVPLHSLWIPSIAQ